MAEAVTLSATVINSPLFIRKSKKMERLLLSLTLLASLSLSTGQQAQTVCNVTENDSGVCRIWSPGPNCTFYLTPDACSGGIRLADDKNSSSWNWRWSVDGSIFYQTQFGDCHSSEYSWTCTTSSVFSNAERNLTITSWNSVGQTKSVVFILHSRGVWESTSTLPNLTNSSGDTGPASPPEKAATLPTDHPPHSPPIAKIVGGSLGGIFGIALVVVVMVVTVGLAVWCIKKRKKDSTSTPETEQAEKGRSQVMGSEPAPSHSTLPPGTCYGGILQPPLKPLSREPSVDDSPFKEPEQAQNKSSYYPATSSGRRSLSPKKSTKRDSVGSRETTPENKPNTNSRFNGGSDPVLMETTVFSDGAYATSHEERGPASVLCDGGLDQHTSEQCAHTTM